MGRETLIIKTGSKLEPELAAVDGDFEDWIAAGLGAAAGPVQVVDARSQALPAAHGYRRVVVTGSSAMVSDRAEWSERAADWLRAAVEQGVPVLGICFGHQLLAHALGGEVGYNPRGVEVGTAALNLHAEAANDPLFAPFPGNGRVNISHRQSVLALPPGARLLGGTALEPHAAFAWGERAWGVQFHPEFDGRVIARYRGWYLAAGHIEDVDVTGNGCDDCPEARALLARFAAIG